jgi:cytochrome c-type biogenesis protein CcmH/NrfF
VSAYLLAAALLLALVVVHVQLWRIRRRLARASKPPVTSEQRKRQARLSIAATWGFAAAALVGAIAAHRGLLWVTPLLFGIVVVGLARLLRVTPMPPSPSADASEREAPREREPSVWDEPSDAWGFDPDRK